MLTFELDWNHIQGLGDDFEKGCRRAGIDPAWLVKIVVEIDLYLPDD